MKSLVAIIAAVGSALAPAIAGPTDMRNTVHSPQVATYRAFEGFAHVVAGKRFTGYFTPAHNACSLSLIVSEADDEALRTPPQRIEVELAATQVFDMAASRNEALGIACTVDADAVKVARLYRPDARTVQRD